MRTISIILISVFITLSALIGIYNFVPLNLLALLEFQTKKLGSTITTIAGSDTLSSSRAVINTNFSNLNTDKIQSGDTAATLTITSLTATTLITGTVNPAVSTTTFSGGISAVAFNSTNGLTAGGSITSTGSGNFTGSLTSAGLNSSSGLTITGGTISSTGKFAITDTATSTIDYGLQVSGTGGYFTVGTTTSRAKFTYDGSVAGSEFRFACNGASIIVNWSNGSKQICSLSTNVTSISFVNGNVGTSYQWDVCQNGTGGFTFKGWSGVQFRTSILGTSTTTPGITTKANTCSSFSFKMTSATGTPIFIGPIPMNDY